MRRCVGLLGRVTDRTPDFVRAVDAPPHGAVAADDEFLAGVCHRVRTPLNGILGSLELLLGEDISDEARELAAAAFESARDLHRVFESELQAEFEPMVEPAVGATHEARCHQASPSLRAAVPSRPSVARPSAGLVSSVARRRNRACKRRVGRSTT